MASQIQPSSSATGQVVVAVLWAGLGRAGRAAGQIVFMLALGRAIGPAGFAGATIALIGYHLVSALGARSFAQALVRQRVEEAVTTATAFWLNLVLAGTVAVVISLSASAVARLLDLAALQWLLPWVTLIAVLGALPVLAQARLTREMKFKTIAKVETLASAAGSLAGLAAVWAGAGVSALIVFAAVQRLVELALFLRMPQSLPTTRPARAPLAGLLSFTLPLAGTQILAFFNGTIVQFFVGVASSPQALGAFGLARRLTQQPTQMIAFAIDRAIYPALVRAGRSDGEARRLFLTSLRLSVVASSMPLALFAIVADDFVMLVLGPDWRSAVIFLQLFALVSMVLPAGGVAGAALRAAGRTGYQLIFQAGRALILFAVLTAILRAEGTIWQMALATAAITPAALLPTAILVCRQYQVALMTFGAQLLRGLLPTLAMVVGILALNQFLPGDAPVLRLVVDGLFGPLIWAVVGWRLFPEARGFKTGLKPALRRQ